MRMSNIDAAQSTEQTNEESGASDSNFVVYFQFFVDCFQFFVDEHNGLQ
jgi:hypothetical protein